MFNIVMFLSTVAQQILLSGLKKDYGGLLLKLRIRRIHLIDYLMLLGKTLGKTIITCLYKNDSKCAQL